MAKKSVINKVYSNKRIKNFNLLDLKLLKWSYITFTLFLITVWPWLRNLVLSVHWAIWLVIAILLMIKPLIKYFK